jgi:hypothetical protein
MAEQVSYINNAAVELNAGSIFKIEPAIDNTLHEIASSAAGLLAMTSSNFL